jgi:hypothetical protein
MRKIMKMCSRIAFGLSMEQREFLLSGTNLAIWDEHVKADED